MNGTGIRSPRALIQAADALQVVLAIFAAYALHSLLWPHFAFLRAPAGPEGFILLAYLALPLWVILVALLGLDRPLETRWSMVHTVMRLIALHLLGLAALTAVTFVTKTVVNRSIVAMFLALSFLLMLVERVALRYWAKRQHAKGHSRGRLLLVGEPGPTMQRFIDGLRADPFPPEVIGYLGRHESDGNAPKRLGTLGQLPGVLHDEAVDGVVVLDQLSPRRAGWVVQVCADLGLSASIPLPWPHVPRLTPYVEAGVGNHFLSFAPSTRRVAQLAVKQVFDLVLASLAVVVLLPVFIGIALAILLLDGRPVVFSQVRVGLHGRRFHMLKFRTMLNDSDELKASLATLNEVDGPAFKVTNDPRVTRLGAFLRRTSLDELPQLFHVLGGAMSLVGPRPLPEQEQQRIRGSQRRRLSMKPGITGLWQTSGRSNVRFSEWMRMDQEYVDRWSLGLDLRLLLATIPAVLMRRGAR
jgi:exopolysaccharide biosynthesis polyprenyl glycosylphosphotransferase